MYDLLVLAFNEKKRRRLNANKICVKPLNKNGNKQKKYYYELWPFINDCCGILYKMYTRDNLGEYECCDDMFEISVANNTENILQKFILDISDECVEDWMSIKLNDEYKEDFIKVFDILLTSSPISTIAFLCRGQSKEKEVIVGTLARNEFIEMLCSGNIKTNICYLVKNNDLIK